MNKDRIGAHFVGIRMEMLDNVSNAGRANPFSAFQAGMFSLMMKIYN